MHLCTKSEQRGLLRGDGVGGRDEECDMGEREPAVYVGGRVEIVTCGAGASLAGRSELPQRGNICLAKKREKIIRAFIVRNMNPSGAKTSEVCPGGALENFGCLGWSKGEISETIARHQ